MIDCIHVYAVCVCVWMDVCECRQRAKIMTWLMFKVKHSPER